MSGEEHRPDIESFYHLLGENVGERACQGMACFVARHLKPERWIRAASQCPRVYCLGKCYIAPSSGPDAERPHVEVRSRIPIVLERIVQGGARALHSYTQGGGYDALKSALARLPEEIIRQVELSGLRGRGGAGFPTGRKWRAVFNERSAEKYIVANADEGDPGAYIDRFIIEDDPHSLIEGMAIAAYAVGARQGYVYLRAEYPGTRTILEEAIIEARREGFLGKRMRQTDFGFDVEIVVGQGSYVCGEETALLNSIEQRRAEVRTRPPYPTSKGLWGKPTLVNNVETLASAVWIARKGGVAYGALGSTTSKGTKVVSLNSLFNRPGLYEIEFGVTVRDIVEEMGGGLKSGRIKGLIIGGPLAGIIPPELFDTPFGFDELHTIGASVGHGGVVAFDEHTPIAELMHHVFEFGAYESCGKCTPCRLGSRYIEQTFRKVLENGHTALKDSCELDDVVSALAMTSLCGHGSGLAGFARSVSRYYGKELQSCFA
jgi:NADH:ubiquinone oxidoreductase subunit F (NADH-binding)